MAGPVLLAVKHVQASGRTIPVFLTRNEGGSVAARCVLDADDTPIVDGPSVEEALQLMQDALESVLLARLGRFAAGQSALVRADLRGVPCRPARRDSGRGAAG